MVKYSFLLYSAVSSVNLYDVPIAISSIKITKFFVRCPNAHKMLIVVIGGLNKNVHITNSTAVYNVLSLPMTNSPNYSLDYVSDNNKPDCVFNPTVQVSQLDITVLTDDGFTGTTNLTDIQPTNNAFIEIEIL